MVLDTKMSAGGLPDLQIIRTVGLYPVIHWVRPPLVLHLGHPRGTEYPGEM